MKLERWMKVLVEARLARVPNGVIKRGAVYRASDYWMMAAVNGVVGLFLLGQGCWSWWCGWAWWMVVVFLGMSLVILGYGVFLWRAGIEELEWVKEVFGVDEAWTLGKGYRRGSKYTKGGGV